MSSSVYRRVLLFKKSFYRSIFTLVEQLKTNLQGIPIPPHSCLQFFPPRAIKYHKIREYSPSKWPTVSLFLTTFAANLSTALSIFIFFKYSIPSFKHENNLLAGEHLLRVTRR